MVQKFRGAPHVRALTVLLSCLHRVNLSFTALGPALYSSPAGLPIFVYLKPLQARRPTLSHVAITNMSISHSAENQGNTGTER